MKSHNDLIDSIFDAALEGTDGETKARRDALWIAARTLMADVLLSYDAFNRERLLRGLIDELREAAFDLGAYLAEARSTPYPRFNGADHECG